MKKGEYAVRKFSYAALIASLLMAMTVTSAAAREPNGHSGGSTLKAIPAGVVAPALANVPASITAAAVGDCSWAFGGYSYYYCDYGQFYYGAYSYYAWTLYSSSGVWCGYWGWAWTRDDQWGYLGFFSTGSCGF